MSESNNLCIVSVREILDDNIIIPGYQRPYRWSTESALTLVSDTYSAFQFFDSQNSRGKELAPHDLLKSYHLREMHDDSESEKVQIINLWENTSQKKLGLLFEKNLFPLVKWYKTQDGLNYSVKDIKTFKGIKKNNNYNFSVYNRAANLYIERFNDEGMYELTSGKRVNQFQLTQPLIAGKRFNHRYSYFILYFTN